MNNICWATADPIRAPWFGKFTAKAGVFLLVVFNIFLPRTVIAQQEISIGPADVYSKVQQIQSELALIRYAMGKSAIEHLQVDISKAEPREVYFQALTLLRKANRMMFEQTREFGNDLELVTGDIQSEQVYAVVSAALDRIYMVKSKLGIMEKSVFPQPDKSHSLEDVYALILRANRDINQLLDRHSSPGDVYRQVTLALRYTSLLLAQNLHLDWIPPEIPFERGKKPVDVYRQLIACQQIVWQMMSKHGLHMLKMDFSKTKFEIVTPSDVYDIATLLVSELAHLYQQVTASDPQQELYSYNPGRKFPSHVYQRVRQLNGQLHTLKDQGMP